MTLYEINGEIEWCAEHLTNWETGEVDEEVLAKLNELQFAREEKIENIGCYIKGLRADSAAIKTEVDALNARRKAIDNRCDHLERYLTEMLGGEKFKSARVAIGQRKSKAVSVADEGALIDWLTVNGGEEALRIKPMELRKDVLRRWLDNGQDIPGCSIEERQSITIK